MTAKLPGLHSSLFALRYPPVACPLRLFEDQAALVAGTPPRRRRVWEVSTSFHCSIIGTCLTTAELRQILIKIDLGAQKETDRRPAKAPLTAGQPPREDGACPIRSGGGSAARGSSGTRSCWAGMIAARNPR